MRIIHLSESTVLGFVCLLFAFVFFFYPPRQVLGQPLATHSPAIQLVDCVQRTVRVPQKVERIACLYAFTGHVVTMLGKGRDIVAVSNGLKRDSLLHRICPSILNATVPKSQGSINIEELLTARPDVVFVPGDVASNQAEMNKLAQFQIPYLVVDYRSVAEQQYAIGMIGEALDARERASQFNEYYQACIARVSRITSQIPESMRPRLYHSVNEPMRTTIHRGLVTDWLSVTGCRNVALLERQQMMGGKNMPGLEQILLWNPEVILANEPSAAAYMLTDSKWSAISAVQNKQVYRMPIGISRWGHPGSCETPLAMLWTAKTLYPDRFRLLDMAEETRAFYATFFNYELSDEMVGRILSGKLVRKPKKNPGKGGDGKERPLKAKQ